MGGDLMKTWQLELFTLGRILAAGFFALSRMGLKAWATKGRLSLLMIALFAACPNANGGYVVLLGDYTPTANLLSPVEEDFGAVRFFNNLLSGGNSTALLGEPTSGFSAHLYQHYNTGGRSASYHFGAVTDQSLSSVELAVVLAPTRAFTAEEAQAIGRLLVGGGNLLAFMDASQSAGLPFVADLLDKLNVDLGSVPTIVDSGQQAAVGNRIAMHPLTVGVDSFRYGATSLVSGGVPLLLTTGGQPFAAAVFVPEPSTILLISLGIPLWYASRLRVT
jgi:hypothetical protein